MGTCVDDWFSSLWAKAIAPSRRTRLCWEHLLSMRGAALIVLLVEHASILPHLEPDQAAV